jgi:predicted Zn-dependent peptidase
MVLMGVGSRHESDQQRGLAHFLEHMVFKGGDRYPNAQAVSSALDNVGAQYNAFTSQEYTGFYAKTTAENLRTGLDVISDMLLNAKFKPEDLEREKGVIVEEINMYEDMPQAKVEQTYADLAYGDTGLGRPIIGTKESVRSFTSDDFKRYREQFYHGSQCTVVVAGSCAPEEVLSMVTEFFASMPAGTRQEAAPAELSTSKERVALETKQSEQTHLILGVAGLDMLDERWAVQRVLRYVLGGTMSSRLFTSVREEQGLCYYVHSYTEEYLDSAQFVVSAGVDNTRLQQAIVAITKELRKIREFGITEEELGRAKQAIRARLIMNLESSQSVAEYYGLQHQVERRIESPEKIVARTEAVTADEVRLLAHELFQDDRLRLAVIGPHHDVHALESILSV